MAKVLRYDFERLWYTNPWLVAGGTGISVGGSSRLVSKSPKANLVAGSISALVSGFATHIITKDTVYDKSGLGNNGQMLNGAHIEDGQLVLDGVDDYVLVPHNPVLNLDSLTIRARVLPMQKDGYTFIWGPKWGNPYAFFVRENNQMVLQFRRNGETYRPGSDWKLPEAGDWYDLGVSRDSETGEVKFYVDGELDSIASAPPGPIDNMEIPFFIGRGGGDRYSECSMDWLEIDEEPESI